MIGEVEEITPKLRCHCLAYLESLGSGEIDVSQPGSFHKRRSRVTVGEGLGRGKRRCIEPGICSRIKFAVVHSRYRITYQVYSLVATKAVARVELVGRSDPLATLNVNDAAQDPASQDVRHWARTKPSLSRTPGQFVNWSRNEAVGTFESAMTVICPPVISAEGGRKGISQVPRVRVISLEAQARSEVPLKLDQRRVVI